MKQSGWMVNFHMRRVEPVVIKDSRLPTLTYHCYQGPKRTYMLHDSQVFDTERLAMHSLMDRMTERHNKQAEATRKYHSELKAVIARCTALEREKS